MRPTADDATLLGLARTGDTAAFERLVVPHRARLHAHCYRMLGSPHDADDALQETLLAAWRGLASFEGRSALGTWLYQIGTHACLRLIAQRPWRRESPDHGPSFHQTAELGEMVGGPVWLEPLPEADAPWHGETHDDPAVLLARRESVALAFVAALQHLPGLQRAVLLLREVLEYSAAEVAEMLGTSVASANSALQRAQKTMRSRLPAVSQPAELQALGEDGVQQLLAAFLAAWDARDVTALARLFSDDVRFTMPPLPSWFDGLADVQRFLAERVFEFRWQMRPLQANGQPGFACYMQADDGAGFRLGSITLLSVRSMQRGRITGLHSFLDPALYRRFGLVEEIA